jgi:hypothetical protein
MLIKHSACQLQVPAPAQPLVLLWLLPAPYHLLALDYSAAEGPAAAAAGGEGG